MDIYKGNGVFRMVCVTQRYKDLSANRHEWVLKDEAEAEIEALKDELCKCMKNMWRYKYREACERGRRWT